jgi:hypothetical protein
VTGGASGFPLERDRPCLACYQIVSPKACRRASPPSGAPPSEQWAIPERIDFLAKERKIWAEGFFAMKALFKSFLTVLAVSTAFVLGFNFGKSKEKAKIPEFQKD